MFDDPQEDLISELEGKIRIAKSLLEECFLTIKEYNQMIGPCDHSVSYNRSRRPHGLCSCSIDKLLEKIDTEVRDLSI